MSSEPRGILFLALLCGAACNEVRIPSPPPAFEDGGLVAKGVAPPRGALKALEGVYSTSSVFGPEAVAHATATTLSLLAAPRSSLAVLQAGCLGDAGTRRLVLEGYWRYLDGTETGLVRLFVSPPEVAEAVCLGGPVLASSVSFSGMTGTGVANPTDAIEAVYSRPRKERTGKFLAGGHRGACLTSSGCAASENSVESIRLTEQLGADLAEMDVRVTHDGVPVLYHDETLNGDLSSGLYCVGRIGDLTYAALLASCRLRGGERLPMLAEALEAAGTATSLLAVWLDVKTPEAVAPTIAVVEAFREKHPEAGLKIWLGLPTDDVLGAYRSAARSPGVECLVEEDAADVEAIPCSAWGPRFTRGPMPDTTRRLQSDGRFVVYWTIDDPGLMDAFLTSDEPNGMLTSFLPVLVHRFEAVGRVPSGGGAP